MFQGRKPSWNDLSLHVICGNKLKVHVLHDWAKCTGHLRRGFTLACRGAVWGFFGFESLALIQCLLSVSRSRSPLAFLPS